MPLIRVTMFFEQRTYGWTESHWYDGPTLDSPLILPRAQTLAQKRVYLSGQDTYIKHLRWSAEGIFRDAFGFSYAGAGLRGSIVSPSDDQNTALLVRMKGANGINQKNIFIRGVWDSVIGDGGLYLPSPTYTGFFDDYRAQLLNQDWGWLGITQTNIGAVTAVTANANKTVHIVCTGNPFPGPFPQKATIRISGVQGAYQVNGVQVVKATDANTCDTAKRIAIFDYQANGTLRFSQKGLINYETCGAQRIVERKAGRPSYQSPGRRKAARAI